MLGAITRRGITSPLPPCCPDQMGLVSYDMRVISTFKLKRIDMVVDQEPTTIVSLPQAADPRSASVWVNGLRLPRNRYAYTVSGDLLLQDPVFKGDTIGLQYAEALHAPY